jgi:hypothetical protein
MIRELLGWDREVIERHMAHVSDEELGDSYDRATFLDQRRQMIQRWANLLDDLAAGKAIPAHMSQPAPLNDHTAGRKVWASR